MRMLWVVAVVAVVGCTEPNPNRCCTDEADCAAKSIPTGSMCSAGLVCRGNQCIAQPCNDSSQCDGAAPFCIDQLCAEQCTDDVQCPGFGGDATAPYCVAGACASCRNANDCTMTAPYCDAGTCRPCTAHNECESELCEFDTGQCIAESTVTYASHAGSTTSNCTRLEPCTLDRAFAVVDASRANVKLAEGSYPPPQTAWPSDLSINIYGPATIAGALGVAGSAVTRIRDLRVTYVTCSALSLNVPRPSLDVERVVVEGIGVGLTSCQLFMRHSTVRNTDAGASGGTIAAGTIAGLGMDMIISDSEIDGGYFGVSAGGNTSLVLTNSIVRNMTKNAVNFNSGSTIPTRASSISFTTFYNTVWTCYDGLVIFTSHNNVFLNEKVGAPADTVSGTLCRHDYDLIKPQTTAPAGANNILGLDPRLVNAAGGDFHLMLGSPAIDAADPAATEAADHDGTPRPQGAGRDIGAFEYKP